LWDRICWRRRLVERLVERVWRRLVDRLWCGLLVEGRRCWLVDGRWLVERRRRWRRDGGGLLRPTVVERDLDAGHVYLLLLVFDLVCDFAHLIALRLVHR
jgi:hypothetical protein